MTAARTIKTLADLHPDDRAELVDGAIIDKAAPFLGQPPAGETA